LADGSAGSQPDPLKGPLCDAGVGFQQARTTAAIQRPRQERGLQKADPASQTIAPGADPDIADMKRPDPFERGRDICEEADGPSDGSVKTAISLPVLLSGEHSSRAPASVVRSHA
jgi:hypothetical protein